MSYEKTIWTKGDIITSEKLNKIEDGIADASNVLLITDQNGTLDYTYQEIENAFLSGKTLILCFNNDYGEGYDQINSVLYDKNQNNYSVFSPSNTHIAQNITDYPVSAY